MKRIEKYTVAGCFLCNLPLLIFALSPTSRTHNRRLLSSLLALSSTADNLNPIDTHDHENTIHAEVVGAGGRMGSLFLTPQSKAVPRGIAPGSWSLPDTPILVTTPAKAWPSIWENTPAHRRDDLVWIGNGMPPSTSSSGTVVVPHFGVLAVGADPITSSESPPTFVWGKHAEAVETVLRARGLAQIERVESYEDVLAKSAQKLLWACSLWLLCHSSEPCTVVEVDAEDLQKLVLELVPALNERLGLEVDAQVALEYMTSYSNSMPQAVPSLALAREEWKERNGFFLKTRDKIPQPFHEQLLQKVGGVSMEDIQEESASFSNNSPVPATSSFLQTEIPSMGLTLVGTKRPSSAPIQTALVVGGGVLGSSVALHLARQGCQVCVVDAQPASSSSGMGVTTPASWAWLNANGKSPPLYAWLNQLGMEGWRRDPVLKHLPTWCGSLVRQARAPAKGGGYLVEGPLERKRLEELEPGADWEDDASVYYYPEEGFVDPFQVVQTLREEATQLGVRFLMGHNVTSFTRNKAGHVNGIITTTGEAGKSETTMNADVVVLAAGIGSTALGNIPLLHSPGQLAFARSSNSQVRLQRILVDTVRECHVLQRQEGDLVVGGGALELGGDGAAALSTQGRNNGEEGTSEGKEEHPLLTLAQRLVPGALGELFRTESAVRPIPLDGLPAVGHIAPGVYCVVSHSGMTLAPILGALAATELAKGTDIETLEPFRPARFFPPT